jgi:hypothetical protein
MTTLNNLEKAETPATTGIPASQRPVITGNFGLDLGEGDSEWRPNAA